MSRASRVAAVLRALVAPAMAHRSPQPTCLISLSGLAAADIETTERKTCRITWDYHVAVLRPHRQFSANRDELQTSVADMPEHVYHRMADQTLDDLAERLESFVENIALEDGDVEYSGVLTLKLGDLGTYVINKQAPNRQIWMSSPVSGPVRYDYLEGKWVYHRDGHHLLERLQKELESLTGGDPDLSPCFGCGKLNSCQGELCQ